MHICAPEALYIPAVQLAQLIAAEVATKVPAAHDLHAARAVTSAYFPASQSEHDAEPVKLYLPVLQLAQDDMPIEPAKVPPAQSAQELAAVNEYLPVWQSLHEVDEVEDANLPEVQLLHAVAPAAE